MRRRQAAVLLLASSGGVLGCGSTGLLFEDEIETTAADANAANMELDAAAPGVTVPPVTEVPPDAALPPIQIVVSADASPSMCPDAGGTLIYLVSESSALLSFDPVSWTFSRIGSISCPTVGPAPGVATNCQGPPGSAPTPFSMAVDRTGIAYMEFCDGELFRVSTANAACEATGFVAGQQGFATVFGMGFVQDTTDPNETLFVASGAAGANGEPPTLASIDTSTFALRVVAPFSQTDGGSSAANAELTGTGAGDLYGFFPIAGPTPPVSQASAIAQIDKATAHIIEQSDLPFGQGSGYAFAFWGGDFYTFTGLANTAANIATVVHRFRPSDGTVVDVASTPDLVVGAGVSTCAPQVLPAFPSPK
ncbi:MAG: hypothetical protein ABSC94_05695 [Polyangiaceae bacterium]|jgi:hypothetical protein